MSKQHKRQAKTTQSIPTCSLLDHLICDPIFPQFACLMQHGSVHGNALPYTMTACTRANSPLSATVANRRGTRGQQPGLALCVPGHISGDVGLRRERATDRELYTGLQMAKNAAVATNCKAER